MVMSLLEDIFQPTFALFFSPNYAKEKERLFDGKIKDKLNQLKAFVGERSNVLDYLTLADFKIAEASHYFEKLYDTEFEKYPFFIRIRNQVENLPEIQKYYTSEKAVKGPFMPTYAQLKF